MEEFSEKEELCQQLQLVDAAMPFSVLLMLAGILAWKATVIRRTGLCDLLLGKTKELPNIFPIYLVKDALFVGSFAFFFCAALRIWEESKCGDETARHSAHLEVWAALFTLAGAILQLVDLIYLQTHQPSLEEEILPD